ncbi:glycoside hydrolase family 3 C-terminal domain-containing protein [Aspergillus alliaceus]|uniref:beta-glucosidase n=1 Tax=Petromyces alliaceus TaxID=209559 RepID=A0A5N7CJG2_PETAA|nr:glycoside hydrolase family 3 C-terminal domain-containing protein [Aspergillus alliaceus]
MVDTVADNCSNTFVMINTVGPRLVGQWVGHEDVIGLLYGSLLAIVEVLYGDVNPSGRLIYSTAKNESDYNVGICYTAQCVNVDYRYFDSYNVTPCYPFSRGLSYTSFSYSDSEIEGAQGSVKVPHRPTHGGRQDCKDVVGNVHGTVSNISAMDGAEVPQLYLGYPSGVQQPVRQLRGLKRVEIDNAKHSKVTFQLRRRDISYWDITAQEWGVMPGKYRVYLVSRCQLARSEVELHCSFAVHLSS